MHKRFLHFLRHWFIISLTTLAPMLSLLAPLLSYHSVGILINMCYVDRLAIAYYVCVGFLFFRFFFKIRLIKPGFPFQETKIHIFELTNYRFSVRSHNHYTKDPTVGGIHRKAFSSFQSCLTDSSWSHLILLIQLKYRSGTVNSNTVNSKFHLIRSYCEIFFYHFPNISCLKCTVNSNFHLIRSKTLPTNDFKLNVPNL